MPLPDPLRRFLEERDRIQRMVDAASAATRLLEEVDYPRRMIEALSPARLYMTAGTMADIQKAISLSDTMLHLTRPALDTGPPSRTVAFPPLVPHRYDTSGQLKRRIEHLEREVEELKAKLNPPPPPPPRKDGEQSSGGQYL